MMRSFVEGAQNQKRCRMVPLSREGQNKGHSQHEWDEKQGEVGEDEQLEYVNHCNCGNNMNEEAIRFRSNGQEAPVGSD